jgi:hypothetical protein
MIFKRNFITRFIFRILISIICCSIFIGCSKENNEDDNTQNWENISPNNFIGSDTDRIQSAIKAAKGTTNKVVIPFLNSNGSEIWLIDKAILLPSNMSIILDNCTLQLSDKCRDNMFRSDNVGIGIKNPQWNYNINITGIGNVVLKGAKNPRATGDSGKKLSLNPDADIKKTGDWRHTYGTDAGKENEKQTGDWRNIMILMAYVNGFKLKNVSIENSHAWAVSHERVINAEISDIAFYNPGSITVSNSTSQLVRNKDGINLRHGCKDFEISNISGTTGDDFIALSTLGLTSEIREGGSLYSTMVTTREWEGIEDDTEQIFISNINCKTPTRAVAIRANSVAGINNVYINGVVYNGSNNCLLIGGQGYGLASLSGKINNIHAQNITGNGKSLILIESAISDCSFINGVYTGSGEKIIIYNIDESETSNIFVNNLTKN